MGLVRPPCCCYVSGRLTAPPLTVHLVDVGRDGFAADAHALAVDEVAVLPEREAAHDDALLTGNHCAAWKRGGGGGGGGQIGKGRNVWVGGLPGTAG